MILKRKKIILWVFFIAVITSAVISLLLPKVYKASVTLMITKPKYQVALEPKIQTLVSTEVSIETYRNLIKDRSLEKKVIEELVKIDSSYKNLTPDDLEGLIIIQGIPNTDLMELKIEANSPEKAMQIANTWAKLFVETNQELSLKETKETQIFINEQLGLTKQDLDKAEDELCQFNKKDKIFILEEKIKSNIEQIIKYKAKLEGLSISFKKEIRSLKGIMIELLQQYVIACQERISDIDLVLLKSKSGLDQIQGQLKKRDEILKPKKSTVNDKTLDIITSDARLSKLRVSRIGLDPIYFDLKLQEVNKFISQEELKAERDNLIKTLAEFNEEIEEVKSELNKDVLTTEELLELASNVIHRISKKIVTKEKVDDLRNYFSPRLNLEERLLDTILSIEVMTTEISQIKVIIVQLNEELDKYKIKLANEKLRQIQLTRMVNTINQTYKVLSQKAEETRIAAATNPGLIKIVKVAYAAEFPIKPHKRRNVLIAGMVGLMFGIFLAFFIEYLEPKKD